MEYNTSIAKREDVKFDISKKAIVNIEE